jgi:two-component system chemotaxis response regulator CheB
MAGSTRPTRVLIVDDSAIVRKMLADALRSEPDIEVVGLASDPFVARDLILRHQPDVLTLDIEMPRMDGLTFLKKLMVHHPLPVIIVSSLTQSGSKASVDALASGAIDVIAKPGGPGSVAEIAEKLKRRIRAISLVQPMKGPVTLPPAQPSSLPSNVRALSRAEGLILIGASAGGTQAIEAVVSRLPADAPPIVIVQHMPPLFTSAFAHRLDQACPMTFVEARGGERLERGVAYVAPGDFHLVVEPFGLTLNTALLQEPPVHFQRPAVDVLFRSAVRVRHVPVVALLLTGMGVDGADGMMALREAGAVTIAQDRESSVVFGMPGEAIARGAAMHVAPLLAMPQLIADALAKRQADGRRAS